MGDASEREYLVFPFRTESVLLRIWFSFGKTPALPAPALTFLCASELRLPVYLLWIVLWWWSGSLEIPALEQLRWRGLLGIPQGPLPVGL